MYASEIVDTIQFVADVVTAYQDDDTPGDRIHHVYFGVGNLEQDGQHWHLMRNLDDEDGICIVKEIQQMTVYGGIVHARLTRRSFMCSFNEHTAQMTRTRQLWVDFMVDDTTWNDLRTQAGCIFADESYFESNS